MQRYLFCYYIKYPHGFEDSVFFTLVEVLKFTDAIDQCLLPKSQKQWSRNYCCKTQNNYVTATLIEVFQNLKVLELEYSNIEEQSATNLA